MFFRLLCFQEFYDIVRTVNLDAGGGVLLVDDVGTSGHADVIEMFQILFLVM